jgi:hypothetical protein
VTLATTSGSLVIQEQVTSNAGNVSSIESASAIIVETAKPTIASTGQTLTVSTGVLSASFSANASGIIKVSFWSSVNSDGSDQNLSDSVTITGVPTSSLTATIPSGDISTTSYPYFSFTLTDAAGNTSAFSTLPLSGGTYSKGLGNNVATIPSRPGLAVSLSSSSRSLFTTPVFPDTPSTYGQAQPDQVAPAAKLSTDLVMEPISMRFAPTVASQTGLSRSIDSSGLSIIQRYAKAAATMAARATAVAKENANAMNTPIQNVRYSLPMTVPESSATETTSVPASPAEQASTRTATGSPVETTGIAPANVRPASVSATENALPRVLASASAADAASIPKGQKNPVPKGETVPRPDFCLGESGKNREEGEDILEDEE